MLVRFFYSILFDSLLHVALLKWTTDVCSDVENREKVKRLSPRPGSVTIISDAGHLVRGLGYCILRLDMADN